DPSPAFPSRAIVVAAADHGIAARGVSAYPTAVTRQMVANFLAGGAAINVLARIADADLIVVDAGVAERTDGGERGAPAGVALDARDGAPRATVRFHSAPIRRGTADMSVGPAMLRTEAEAAIGLGLQVGATLVASGTSIVGVGEMGIGNTTAASAVVAVMAGADPADVTGTGTGIDAGARARKIDLIERSIAVNRPDAADPVGVLAAVGGLEIGVLVGVILGCVAGRVPVILDGFITGAAALLAVRLAPAVAPRLIASHRSPEPGHAIALDRLGARPLLELDLRLGEGSGAALALGLLDAACAVRDGMATFASAAVAGPSES
ncbi:MAG TPA: nicotinate-nucleotide--dimethylbenzimidazole phosphoribosyltransferase, partial [Candidatus Limnocylindrales bacterium]